MHDRATDPIGAATSVTAATIEIMILLSIEVGIAQVRLPVEEKRSARLYSYSRASARDGYDTLHTLRASISLAISPSHL